MTAPCSSCSGRGWKYVSLRQSVVAAEYPAEAAIDERHQDDCWRCNGTGQAGALL
ncbi:hypothetical protein AB0C28_21670 [Nonomuraea sp. NPDC048892]|uniref:hypothetical protein n=1 Tax=Nonomuraea sp. NPDC048892 TaxID=3154624 RepID=UPI0033C7D870